MVRVLKCGVSKFLIIVVLIGLLLIIKIIDLLSFKLLVVKGCKMIFLVVV